MDIGELIEHNEESIFLDFKREEYHAENKPELIKDVLAFANASYVAERYIIIGVSKDHEGITITPVLKPQDAATIQQYIHDNITPELIVSYEPYNYKGQNLMVLTISGTEGQPFYPSKLITRGGKPFLRENDLWIRKGSHKVLGVREDLERLYARRYAKDSLEGKISVTFKSGTQTLELNVIRNLEWPTVVNKMEIEQQIVEKEALLLANSKLYIENYGSYYPGSGSNSYQAMDLNTLRMRLKTVERDFSDEDKHYLYERRAYKLQLIISNSGNEHLKDVLVELIFPDLRGLTIADHVYLNTHQLGMAAVIDYQADYPEVVAEKDVTIVRQKLDEVRHKIPADVFTKPLSIVPLEEAVGKVVKVKVTVYASNLPNPQDFELAISFK